MTEAMHITVSSDMEKRMDDKSSTTDRSAREPVLSSRPCVESVIAKMIESKTKKASHQRMRPPTKGSWIRKLTQTSDVVGHGFNFTVIQFGGHLRHRQVVFAHTITKGSKLGTGVFCMLAA